MSALKKSIPRMVNKRSGFDFVRKPVGVGKDNEMRGTSARQKTNEVIILIENLENLYFQIGY